ncbi:MAG: very short patch repair endonuclease [Candidatus Omnitrophota bacterium]
MKRRYKRKSKEIVSYTMSRIRSKGTTIESIMAMALKYAGFPFRRYYNIFGKPDFVIVPLRLAIFCDSDFWHGKNWVKLRNKIRVNRGYWIPKIKRNIERDKEVTAELKRQAWLVMRFWESEIYTDINSCVEKIVRKVEQQKGFLKSCV